MSYLVVNLVDGKLGVIHERDTFEEAADCAVQVAAEQCTESEDDIRAEVETDLNFTTADGSIQVCLAQAERV